MAHKLAAHGPRCHVSIQVEQPGTGKVPIEAFLSHVSMNGVAVLLPCELARGAFVLLRMRGGFGRMACERWATVKHCRRDSEGWAAGCEFQEPMSAADLTILLAHDLAV